MSSKSYFYVYAWLNHSGDPYYIGKGQRRRAYRTGSPKGRVKILHENLTSEEAFELEKKLIKKYGRKDLGEGILINKTNGGGSNSGWNPTPESRAKMRAAKLGRTNTLNSRLSRAKDPSIILITSCQEYSDRWFDDLLEDIYWNPDEY